MFDNYDSIILIPIDEINMIKGRMDIYDKLREDVIKSSRDVQKLSKQVIIITIFFVFTLYRCLS